MRSLPADVAPPPPPPTAGATPADAVARASKRRRVWAVSDVHVNARENWAWVEALSRTAYQDDALIVAGDLCETIPRLEDTLRDLRARFGEVFFVPGNHELWCVGGAADGAAAARPADSLAKLRAVEGACARAGVRTRAGVLWADDARRAGARGVLVVPLLSWHHQSFDTEPDIVGWRGLRRAEQLMSDYVCCQFPTPLSMLDDSVAEHLDALNDEPAAPFGAFEEVVALAARARRARAGADRADGDGADGAGSPTAGAARRPPPEAVISFSHFLPRIELNPEKRYLFAPALAKAVGSRFLGQRVQRLRPDVHVFGHTHFGWDAEHDGVRFVQPPLGYPQERRKRPQTMACGERFPAVAGEPLLLWDSELVARSPPDAPPPPPPDRGAERDGVAASGGLRGDGRGLGFVARYETGWANFYRHYPREPENNYELPEYVARNYEKEPGGPGVVGWGGRDPAWAMGPTCPKCPPSGPT